VAASAGAGTELGTVTVARRPPYGATDPCCAADLVAGGDTACPAFIISPTTFAPEAASPSGIVTVTARESRGPSAVAQIPSFVHYWMLVALQAQPAVSYFSGGNR